MRILVVNPNMSSSLTDRLVAAAAPFVGPGTDLIATTAERGFPYISSRAEAHVAASIVLETIAANHGTIDAAVVAAFGDPGLLAAREVFDVPVTGMAEASMLTACAVGERFAFVTFSPSLSTWYLDAVARARLEARFVGVRAPQEGFTSVDTVQQDLGDALGDLVARAASDGADVAILAGAPLAGLAATLADRLPIPVIDPIVAAVLQAETLVRLGVRKATAGSLARPPAKESTGLPEALAARIAHAD